MKIFLSWSGELSRQVAEAFSEWIQCVIQACKPWISTRDIERGSIWFNEISEQIKDVSVGVIFLTLDNKEKPWILFETGALAKGLTNSRVCTFLINLTPADLQDPLAQFNHTLANKASVLGLVRTLNAALIVPMEEKILEKIYNTYWPQLESSISRIRKDFPEKTVAENENSAQDSLLKEIYLNIRTLNNRLARIESKNNTPLYKSPNVDATGRQIRRKFKTPPQPEYSELSFNLAREALNSNINEKGLFDMLKDSGLSNEQANEVFNVYNILKNGSK